MKTSPPDDRQELEELRRLLRSDGLRIPEGLRSEQIVQKLRAMEPILLDVLPLTLEEVFTYEMETLGYTFQIDDLLEEESEHAKS